MKQSARLSKLLELISDQGGLTVSEAEEALGVSGATIRRDFEHLAAQQLIVRSRGGALPVIGQPISLQYRASKHETSMQRIAAYIASTINPGATVGLNASPGAVEVARALATDVDMNTVEVPGSGATIVTNATNIAHELSVRRHLRIMLTGGMARPQSYTLLGRHARRAVSEVSLDLAVIGVAGIDSRRGVTASDPEAAEIDGLFCAQAARVVVVAKADQVGEAGLARVCDVEMVSEVVTTASPKNGAAIEALRDAGVQVTVIAD